MPDPPQLSDFDKELQDYKAHVESEIAQEAEATGMTVEEYAANGYEPQEQPTDVQEQPEETPSADTVPEQTAVRYYTINEGAARRANDANSYRDYAAGSATAEYRQMVDQAAAIAQRQKERVDPMYHEKIDALLDTYARKLAENLNDHYAIEARVPSILVAGGSNFPVRKKEKQNAARDRNMQEWQDVQGILDKIRSTGMGGISMDDPQAAAKLEAKLVKLESAQETMKAVNAYFRKNKTLKGCPSLTPEQITKLQQEMAQSWHLDKSRPYPAYMLSNNNAEIRRIRGRIEQVRQHEDTHFAGWEFDGGRVEANKADNRLQVFFDGKPDEAARDELKANGFRWAPSVGAWQRQLNKNAYYAAGYISCIQPISGEKPIDVQRSAQQQESAVPDGHLTGERVSTPRGSFHVANMTREQMEAAGYGYHHSTDDGKYLIMGNGTQAFAIAAEQREQENYMRMAELSTEQNYNMIDGQINNTPSVDELEEKAKRGEVISLSALAAAVKAEDGRTPQIMQQNTAAFQSDFDIDKKILTRAAKSKNAEDRVYLWFSRPNGTHCLRERDVFLRGTREHNTFRFYHEQTKERVLAYAVVLSGMESGKVKGSIYELDYAAKAELAIQTALRTDNNRLIYENGSRELPKECRFEATPDREYGKFVRYEAVPHDPDALRDLLRDESRKSERLKPGNFKEHIGRLSDEKVLAEAQRLSAAFQSLQAPNSPNGTHFAVEVSPWFERIASSKEHERLFALLPYKTLYLSSVKDRHGVFAFISKDERRDLPLRKQRPSVRAQLKEGQSKKTAAPKKAAAKTKDNDLEV